MLIHATRNSWRAFSIGLKIVPSRESEWKVCAAREKIVYRTDENSEIWTFDAIDLYVIYYVAQIYITKCANNRRMFKPCLNRKDSSYLSWAILEFLCATTCTWHSCNWDDNNRFSSHKWSRLRTSPLLKRGILLSVLQHIYILFNQLHA